MKKCVEFAFFLVDEKNIERAIILSKSIFTEMNEKKEVITFSEVLQKTDNPGEICWHLTWTNEEDAKNTTAQWPTFPSTDEFQKLIVKDLYYGHFV